MSAQFNAPDKFFTATFNAGTTVKAPESDYDRKLKPDSWGEALHDAADRGEVPRKAVPVMMVDYMGPSLDTMIFAITSAVWLFAQHLSMGLGAREPEAIPSAVNEVLRMEAPIQDFSRYAVEEFDMDGVTLPADSRAIVFYGAANRDEREYPDPDRFEVRRNPTNHMAFGTGPHVCLGQYLARLEMTSLFTALARRVRRFELGDSERALHNILRGFTKLHVTVS